MAKRGPPKVILDWGQIAGMCKIHCTGAEIAAIMDVDYDTLQRLCKDVNKMRFTDYYKKHASGGKMALRRVQMKSAIEGNVTMQIWMGKNLLDQRDQPEDTTERPAPVLIINHAK